MWEKIDNQAFPEETRYSDMKYAKQAYTIFTDALRKSATARAIIFATKHREATELLMELLEKTGLITYVGKINMDQNAPDNHGDCYDRYDLFGNKPDEEFRGHTAMAHCVYSSNAEVDLIQKNGVFVAHCPTSNMNLSSGIAPIGRYLDRGIRVGLGSDVAGNRLF